MRWGRQKQEEEEGEEEGGREEGEEDERVKGRWRQIERACECEFFCRHFQIVCLDIEWRGDTFSLSISQTHSRFKRKHSWFIVLTFRVDFKTGQRPLTL
jgi:hypothetical protein